MGILIALLTLSLIILVHEYGHYWMMRRCGVQVVEFTIGFGPTLWEKELKSGTIFRLKPIILGGYTRPVETGPNSMEQTTRGQRALIYLGGMLANAVTAFVAIAIVRYLTMTYLGILHPLVGWAPRYVKPGLSALLESFGIWLATPFILVWFIVRHFSEMLGSMSGPIGIIAFGSQVATIKATAFMRVMAWLDVFGTLSAAVAGFNLIPLMPLDGGRILDLLVEKWLPYPAVIKAWRYAGVIVFLGLIVLAFSADISRFILHRH